MNVLTPADTSIVTMGIGHTVCDHATLHKDAMDFATVEVFKE